MTEFPSGELRPTYGASISPDGTAFAHIVDDGGYPRAVQRFLRTRGTGSGAPIRAGESRPVVLPVEGPITRIIHSPDGGWLACQTAPGGGIRTQVWVVTTDPDDRDAHRIDDADGTAELIGWDGALVAVNALDADGSAGEAQLVDPRTGLVTVVHRQPGARLVDSWAGSTLIRTGPRGDRELVLVRGGIGVPLFPRDPGSTSDPGVILDDRKPMRLLHVASESRTRLYRPAGQHGFASTRGFVRILVRSDVNGTQQRPPAHDFARLLLVTVTEHGVSHRVMAERDDADLDEFAVSDNLSTVALLWNRAGASELQLLELSDGTLREPLPLPGNGEVSASELSITADGTLLALTVQSPGRPRSVQVVDPRSGCWEPVEPAIRQPDAVRPTLVRFPARDGLQLSGWFYPAPGTGSAGSPTAAVIYLHGGPEGQAVPDYSELFPAILAAGISVLAPNVRGSGGFGRAFSHADDGPLRFAGIDDVADCVAFLVDQRGIDPARIGCAGWSYGGYLTLAALAFHPELFAAGISICGMSDLRSFYANTEPWIAQAAYPKYGHPVRDRDLLGRLSPMTRLDAISAPLLLVHGGRDTNVPTAESEQIAAALAARGARVELVIFPDEGHAITKQENRAQLVAVVEDWLVQGLLR